jgi:hypothetical protein
MNCRFTPIDARIRSVMRSLVLIDVRSRAALPPCPGEGSGGSS